jgi:hypothetical protein
MANESINTTKTTPAILFSHSRPYGFVSNIYWRILLTAIGLTPGGSSAAHIYTQTYTEQHKQYTQNRTYITIRIHKRNKNTQFTKLKMIVKLFI